MCITGFWLSEKYDGGVRTWRFLARIKAKQFFREKDKTEKFQILFAHYTTLYFASWKCSFKKYPSCIAGMQRRNDVFKAAWPIHLTVPKIHLNTILLYHTVFSLSNTYISEADSQADSFRALCFFHYTFLVKGSWVLLNHQLPFAHPWFDVVLSMIVWKCHVTVSGWRWNDSGTDSVFYAQLLLLTGWNSEYAGMQYINCFWNNIHAVTPEMNAVVVSSKCGECVNVLWP